jgi:hypothetical protein
MPVAYQGLTWIPLTSAMMNASMSFSLVGASLSARHG